MERAPLPARASQGEGDFSNGECIKMRPIGDIVSILSRLAEPNRALILALCKPV